MAADFSFDRARILTRTLAGLAAPFIISPVAGFPVGMMTEIVRARKVLALHLGNNAKPYELKRQTIQDCIYGVDLDPGAIEIAKLRLWLSLVVDEDNFDQIQALPNLDYKIMQGNSLLQTYEGVKLFDDTLLRKHDNNVRRRRQLEEEMRDLRDQLMAMLTRATNVTNPKDKKTLESRKRKRKLTRSTFRRKRKQLHRNWPCRRAH